MTLIVPKFRARVSKPNLTNVKFSTASMRAFTLVELMVVVAIIVILLAILVSGLDSAMKASVRSACAANQRGIATAAASYALENERFFPGPVSPNGVLAASALIVRNRVPLAEDRARRDHVTGIGYLVADKRIGGMGATGGALHCPALETQSANPASIGMDLADSDSGAPDRVDTSATGTGDDLQGSGDAQGASFWLDENVPVASGYNYRGMSYYRDNNGALIHTISAKSSFLITTDLITYVPGGEQYGREYHHETGWNASFGDGHVEYIKDPEAFVAGDTLAETNGFLEREIAQGHPIIGATDEDAVHDERVFTYLAEGTVRSNN